MNTEKKQTLIEALKHIAAVPVQAPAASAVTAVQMPKPHTIGMNYAGSDYVNGYNDRDMQAYGDARAEEARREVMDTLTVTNRQLTNALAHNEQLKRYVADMEDSLQQIADAVGVTVEDVELTIARAKELAAAQRTAGGDAVRPWRDLVNLNAYPNNRRALAALMAAEEEIADLRAAFAQRPPAQSAAAAPGAEAGKVECKECDGTGSAGFGECCTDCYGYGYTWDLVEEAAAQADGRWTAQEVKDAAETGLGILAFHGFTAPAAQPTPRQLEDAYSDGWIDGAAAVAKPELAAAQPTLTDDERASAALRKLCDQLDAMKRTMFLRPGTGQHYSYLVHEDVAAYVEQARAALAAKQAGEGK